MSAINMVIPIVEKIVRENPKQANRFGVMRIPTPVVMENGKIVNQAMGASPKHAIFGIL